MNVSLPIRARFRTWLLEELRVRRWTQVDLAERTGVSQGTVAKWLAPPESSLSRLPSYESCLHLAKALQLPVALVLDTAGLETPDTTLSPFEDLSPLQQKIVAMISHIPDSMLELLYHQLVPMVDRHVQQQLLESMKEHASRERSDPSR